MDRQKYDFYFKNQVIDEQEFQKIIYKEAKKIKRISSIEFKDYMVRFVVQSSSGISDWAFVLDFNDYGKLTGRSWVLDRENYDSSIPSSLQNKLFESINEYLATKEIPFCPNCGTDLIFQRNFDENKRVVVCEKCNCELLNPKCDDEYIWHCSNCGSILNNQVNWDGEKRKCHTCVECGEINNLNEKD